MGTRHLICVYKGGEYKVAQYGQWDGYPSGQGIDILQFLHTWDRPKFEKQVDKLTWITGAEYDKIPQKTLADRAEFSRDTSAKLLPMIQNSKRKLKLVNNIDFAGDSLFCEWAYVIDLDENTFEVFEGGMKIDRDKNDREDITIIGRFDDYDTDGDYDTVKPVAVFALDDLPDADEFLNAIKLLQSKDYE